MSAPIRKRGPPQIVVPAGLQVPNLAKVAPQYETSTNPPATGGGLSRAQFKEAVHTLSPGGSPVPLPTSRTTDHFRTPPQTTSANSKQHRLAPVQPPASWDESLTGFLARLCSTHPFGLESLSVWNDEVARIKTPAMQTREQWSEADGYARYLAQQMAANNPLTGNLNWAMFHFLVNMRCLRTVDFLSDIDPVLRNLQFILRIILKALCLILDNDRLRKVLADRPISSDITDLITDKFSALEDGEVRSHAFKQTLADPLRLHQQLLHYILLAISKLDIRSSQSAYMLYQDLVAMLLDLFSSQVHAEHIDSSTNVFINELLDNVGPSTVFNVDRTPAQEVVETLLLNVSEAPAFPSGQGLVLSAYSYFFSRQPLAVQARHLEQQSLMLLLLLASQPSPVDGRPRNPFLAALEGVADAPEPAIKIENRVSFRRLFAKIVAEIQSIEWTVLFQVLVARNNAFRTYVLARTDPDTVIIPLLKRISAATALPVPSASNSHHSHGPHKRDSLPSSGFGASISANGGGSGSGKQGEKFTGSIFSSPKLAAASSPTYASFISEPLQKDSVLQQPQQLQQQQPWSPMSQSMLSPINTKGLPATTLTTTTTTTTTTTATPRTGTVSSATPTSATTAQAGTTPTAPSPSIKLRQGAAPQSILTVDTVPYVQLYCWMDILLCLSSDAQFVEQLQRTTIEFWASTPHPMHRQPLSLCMVAEAMRIFQLNIMLLKDAHIHGLSLGILSNILNESTNITTAISQKLVKLFEMIHRRYSKLTSMPELALVEVEERHVYEETLTALLALFCKLVNSNNPQFIYCLLQAREILGSFRKPTSDSGSADGIADKAAGYSAELRVRIAYFHARVATLVNPQTRDILGVIESVVGSGKPGATDGMEGKARVAFCSKISLDGEWTGFMLPLVWELLASSIVSVEGNTPLLEEFENLVL